MILTSGEVQKPRVRRHESARVVVERREAFVKVDLHPLAPRLLRVLCRSADEFGADAAPLSIGATLRIDQERVVSTIPGDSHEPDEYAVTVSRRDPPEAVRAKTIPLVSRRRAIA